MTYYYRYYDFVGRNNSDSRHSAVTWWPLAPLAPPVARRSNVAHPHPVRRNVDQLSGGTNEVNRAIVVPGKLAHAQLFQLLPTACWKSTDKNGSWANNFTLSHAHATIIVLLLSSYDSRCFRFGAFPPSPPACGDNHYVVILIVSCKRTYWLLNSARFLSAVQCNFIR